MNKKKMLFLAFMSIPLINAGAQVYVSTPALSFTGNSGFVNDVIEPNMPTKNSQVRFEIKYTQAQNLPPLPGYPQLIVKQYGSIVSTNTMQPLNISDISYSDGKDYYTYLNFPNAGVYEYYFLAISSNSPLAVYSGSFFVSNIYRYSGDFSTAAFFGSDVWDEAYDIALDTKNAYLYALGHDNISGYLVKYSPSGAMLDYKVLPPGINYKKMALSADFSHIYLGGEYYDYNLNSNRISIAKYDSSLVFISSTSILPGYFQDMSANSSSIFSCFQSSIGYTIASMDYNLKLNSTYPDMPVSYSSCRKLVSDDANVFALIERDNDNGLVGFSSSLVFTSSVSVSSANYYTQMAIDQSKNLYLAGNTSICSSNSCQNYIAMEKRDSSLSLSTQTYFPTNGWSQPSDIFVDTNSNVAITAQVQNGGNSDYGLYVFDALTFNLKNLFFSDSGYWDNPKALVIDPSGGFYVYGVSEVNINSLLQSDSRIVKFTVNASQNREPSLFWANENGYWSDGIEPHYAMLGDSIVYKVKYQDLDNDPTSYMRVRIYKDAIEVAGSPFNMEYDSGLSPAMGITYKFVFSPGEPGYYSYKFEAQDFHNLAAGLQAIGYPAQQIHYGPNIGEGFLGNLSLSTGISYSMGGQIEPEDITVFSRSGEGDYVYALAKVDNSPYILRLSTDSNAVAISSQIISNDPYSAEIIFNDASNIYLAGLSDIGGNYWLDVKQYDRDLNNIKSGSFSIATSQIPIEDAAFHGSLSYILSGDEYNGKKRARISAFDSSLTHVGILGADDIYFRAHNASGSIYFDAYPDAMSVDQSGDIFVAGYYYDNQYSTSSSNNIFVAKFDASSGYAVSSFTFTSPGQYSDDKASGIDIDLSGNIYVSGNISNGQKNLWLILKLDSSLNLIASRVFDAGEKAESMDISFSTQTNSVFISGTAYGKDNYSEIRKGLVIMLDSDLVFKSSFTYGADQNEENYFGPMALNFSGEPYVLGFKRYWGYNYGAEKLTSLKPIFSVDRPNLTITAIDKSNSLPIQGMNVAMIPYNSKGYPDMSFMDMRFTNSLGLASFSVVKGVNYLVAFSTPRFGPRVIDQIYDPYGNFNKTFYSNTVSTYTFTPMTISSNTLKVNINDVYKGAFLTGEVYLIGNNERVGYAILLATAASSTMDIYNLPNLSPGTYGINISMPGWLAKDVYPSVGVPYSLPLSVDMKDAMPPFSNYTQTVSTSIPYFSGFVGDMLGNPLSGALIRTYCNCTPSGCGFSKTVYSDSNGRFAMYGYDATCTPLYYEIGHIGYSKIPKRGYSATITPPALNQNFNLEPATYSVSGYIKYMGNPLAYAKVRIGPDWQYYCGADSYMKNGSIPINNSEFFVETDGDGYFNISGLSDGNMSIQVENPMWKNISGGMDNDSNTKDDNIRITISSSGATSVPGYPCVAGKNWVLDSTGTCKGIMPYVFDIGVGMTTNAVVAGDVIFATTYTVSSSNPLIIPKSSSVVIGLFEDCSDCPNRKSFFATISGVYNSNIIPYSVNVSSWDYVNGKPIKYWLNVLSNSWAKLNSFDGEISFSTSNILTRNINLVKSGRLIGSVKNKDGSFYVPSQYRPEIVINGKNISYDMGTELKNEGTFEFPNVPGGKYDVSLRFGVGSPYVPLNIEDVTVSEGKTTNITFTLNTGLYVQPQVYGLPDISTASWKYKIIAVPSGQQMNSSFITEMFFKEPMYAFEYDSSASTWSVLVLPEGRFDFYLTLTSKYCTPGDTECGNPNYTQFANFIGKSKSVDIKHDPNSPNSGTLAQPINISILGSLGQNYIGGSGKGKRIFTDSDYERLFSDFFNQIIHLIPSVMIYDTAGELRGFSNVICDSDALLILEEGIKDRNSEIIKESIANGHYKYYLWGLPPGKYTAVFFNPNYPPVTKNITLPDNSSYDFDFDAFNISVGNITGVVMSSSNTPSPLSGAMIQLKGRTFSKYSITDSSGVFVFSDAPAGSYKMEVSMDGFAKLGKKFTLGKDDSLDLGIFYLKPTTATLSGKIYFSKFPTPKVKEGIKVSAYDETINVSDPQSYLPLLEDITDENGIFELKGLLPGHNYKLVVAETGKKVFSTVTYITDGINNFGEIALSDLPPEIVVKLRKDPDSAKKVNVIIQSPKELVSIPSCKYNEGQVYDSSIAVSLALVPAANNTYMGQFTLSASRYYTLNISAGDYAKVEKTVIYDSISNSKTEQYISAASLLGGNVYMDSEKEEYSGLELDAGALTQTSAVTVDFSDLAGGFFSALPSVRTVKTNKGDLSIDSVLQNIMASEVYDIDLSNAQANKSFTLSLKYDKEKAASSGSLKIYQYDSNSGLWREVPGTYDIDPTLGVISVGVDSIDSAYEGASGGVSPLARKVHKMSSISPKGYYVPNAVSSSQSGKFAVFSAKPPSGISYSGSAFEVYNMPNPFNLKEKTISVSDGWSGVQNTNYVTRGTLIKYFLPTSKSGNLKFVIYNNAGEKVRTLDEGSRSGGQVYYSEWDGKNDNNQDCASGIYFLMTYLNGDKLGNKPHKMALIK